MQYRQLNGIDWKASALGFGCMRLPVRNNNPAEIIEDKAIHMIRYAIDNGVNYCDTAYVYHGGMSEVVLGKALKDGYRAKVKIADKLPLWGVEDIAGVEKIFEEHFERLKTDHIDFYLLHALSRPQWETVKKLNLIEWGERKKKEGRISYFGFSFHDKADVFREIVDAHTWDFCMIQHNYIDTDFQAGSAGLIYAHEKGTAVNIMEPLRGGDLVRNIPLQIEEIWNYSGNEQTYAQRALSWLWNKSQVGTVLSGMQNIEEVMLNIEYASEAEIGILTEKELGVFDEIRQKYKLLKPIGCTNCTYCVPCPRSVNIPLLLYYYNEWNLFHNKGKSKFMLSMIPEDKRSHNCNGCGECMQKCPQQLHIPDLMKEITALYKYLKIEGQPR
ncbi:MAG: aldo/keto reductase [Candidatus Cloacimonetes bacterium]|nr:aldo/keto reductase [Candidatus Cloacimonadota bacterium]